MDTNNNQNQTQPSQEEPMSPPQPTGEQHPASTSAQSVEPVKKKKRSTLPLTIAFLAGAMTYAVAAAGYNVYVTESNKEAASTERREELTAGNQATTPTNPGAPTQDASVSKEDLEKYVEVTDCTTKTNYSSYTRVFEKGRVQNINLYDGLTVSISSGTSSRMLSVEWEKLPQIVDYKCEPLKITNILARDRVNVYADEGTALTSPILNARLIQKATK